MREGGSAVLIATVIAFIVIGIAGAFFAGTVFSQKAAGAAIEADETSLICDAILEKTRRALYVYKANSVQISGMNAWDFLLSQSQTSSLLPGPNQASNDHWSLYQAAISSPTSTFTTYQTNWLNGYTGTTAGLNSGGSSSDDAPSSTTDAQWFFNKAMPFGKGGYFVTFRNNNSPGDTATHDVDGQMFVYVTAMLPDKTIKQIEALVQWLSPTYTPQGAIVSDGTIVINGGPTVNGTLGSVMSNGDLVINGASASIGQGPSPNTGGGFAAGTVYFGGVPPAGSTTPPGALATPLQGWNSGQSPMTLPDVVPSYFKSPTTWPGPPTAPYAVGATPTSGSFILMSDGNMYDFTGGVKGDKITNTGGWTYASGQWKLSGGTNPPAGVYYVDSGGTSGLGGGNVLLSGAGGSINKTMTIIAEGSVTTTGNVSITPYGTTNTAILAGRDINLGGTAGTVGGLVAAHEQVSVHGNFTLTGSVMAKNAEDLSSVVSSSSVIDPSATTGTVDSGNTTVTFNGFTSILPNPNLSVTIQNMRRLK